MKTNQAIQLAGSASALAVVLGLTRAAVSQWGEDVPVLRQYQLKELRPQWFCSPENIAPAQSSPTPAATETTAAAQAAPQGATP